MCWGGAHGDDSDLEKKYNIQYPCRNDCVYGLDKNHVGVHGVDINLLIGYETIVCGGMSYVKTKDIGIRE